MLEKIVRITHEGRWGLRHLAKEAIHQKLMELVRRIKETSIVVALLGASGKGLEERRRIGRKLEEKA